LKAQSAQTGSKYNRTLSRVLDLFHYLSVANAATQS